MERTGWIHCNQTFDTKFLLQWDIALSGIGKYSSPNFGLMCGTFSNCHFEIVFGRYKQEYRQDRDFVFRINILAPKEMVNNCPKINFTACLLNDAGIQLTSNMSAEAWITVTPRMKILELDKIEFKNIIKKNYHILFGFKLLEVDDYEIFAKNMNLLRTSSSDVGSFLENSVDDDSLDEEVKVKNSSITNSFAGNVNSKLNVEYPEDLIQDLKTLYNTGVMSDINICIGEETIQAHKLILGARSLVFQKMMEHAFVESTSNCITITDCESTVFKKFLKYLYTNEIEDKTVDTVMELYTLADKYDVKGLRMSCSKILQSEFLSSSSDYLADIVTNVLQLADCRRDLKVKDLAMTFIIRHFPEVTDKQSWNQFLKSNSELTSEVLAKVATALRKATGSK